MKLTNLLCSWAVLGTITSAAQVTCDATHSCPESVPCCGQFNTCGTGRECLGGCNPLWSFKPEACMPQPIMKSGFRESMNDKLKIFNVDNYLGNPSEGKLTYNGFINNFDNSLLLQLPKDSGGTVVSSAESFLYGRVGVDFKSAAGVGVVSAFILYSNVQDEVDMEYMGYDNTLQTNYYYRGHLDFAGSKTHNVPNIDLQWHRYEIEWKEDETNWYIDGVVVRTLKREDTWDEGLKKFKYMDTPCRVQLSIWAAGAKSSPPGTRQWAGGEIDWDSETMKKNGYYFAIAKNLEVNPSGKDTDHNAFEYQLSGDGEVIVHYTNEKTWLGSKEASGLDPQNSGSLPSLSTSKSSSSSLSLSKSKSSSSRTSKSSSSRTTTGKINPATGNVTINAFLATSSTSSTSSSSAAVWQQGTTDSTTKQAGASRVEGFVGFLSLMAGLLLWS